MIERPDRRFAFRLALALGAPHPDHLQRLLTAEQFTEWAAYFDLEPWGEEAADLRAGTICASIATFSGKVLQKGKVLSWRDFFPDRLPKKTATPPSLSDKVKGFFRKRADHG